MGQSRKLESVRRARRRQLRDLGSGPMCLHRSVWQILCLARHMGAGIVVLFQDHVTQPGAKSAKPSRAPKNARPQRRAFLAKATSLTGEKQTSDLVHFLALSDANTWGLTLSLLTSVRRAGSNRGKRSSLCHHRKASTPFNPCCQTQAMSAGGLWRQWCFCR